MGKGGADMTDLLTTARAADCDARKPLAPRAALPCDLCTRPATLMGCTADGWHFWLCGEHDGVSGEQANEGRAEVES